MTLAIRAEGLAKRYTLGRRVDPHRTLRDAFSDGLARAGRLARRLTGGGAAAGDPNEFWALRGVSFEVRQGEAVGLIGGNGAGKSTLLKLLTRITVPTAGRARIRGRVGSLLEVGTGFHPDLTGRENVFLNGAILGMRRDEVVRKFDEIVAFAEVERFIDTPVKRYSSGMYLRLAFGVAAHLEPVVLLVDEVLAVGDAAFQRKCLGKMGDVAREGRTVLLVSHNMEAVQRLCGRVLMLEQGTLVADGESREVTTRYLLRASRSAAPGERVALADVERRGTGAVRFVEARYRNPAPGGTGQPVPGGPLEVEAVIEAPRALTVGSLAVVLRDVSGLKLVNADTLALGESVRLNAGRNVVRFEIDAVHLTPGTYVLGVSAADVLSGAPFDLVERAFELDIVPAEAPALGTTPRSNGLVPCRFSAHRIT